jgi:hypothetical protein
VWDTLTFAQFLIAIEEMQTQQRAENGITEVIIGYVGEEPLDQAGRGDVTNLTELGTQFMDAGTLYQSSLDGLPDDIRSVVLAEAHRQETGTVLPATFYKLDKKPE